MDEAVLANTTFIEPRALIALLMSHADLPYKKTVCP